MASPWQRITTIKPIRNGLRPAPLTQFAITFCNGDLTPTQNLLPIEALDLNPQSSLKKFGYLKLLALVFDYSEQPAGKIKLLSPTLTILSSISSVNG
jgi:hypothetical protein